MRKSKWFCFFLVLLNFSRMLSAEEAEAQVEKKFPLGADIYLSNNVGAGSVSKAYEQGTFVASSLFVYPHLKFGPFAGDRAFNAQAEMSGMLEWVSKDNPIDGQFTKKMKLGELKMRMELQRAWSSKELGLSLTPAFKMEVPTSEGSRAANRMIGLGGYFVAGFKKNGFFLSYKPVGMGYVYSAPYKSGECAENAADGDKLSGGQCKVAGRQTMALLKNGIFGGYNTGNHTIKLGYRSYHQFLRAPNSGEKAETKKSSGILEASLALVEYSYDMKLSLPTTISVGVTGFQAPYDASEKFRFPFFSFDEPSKNETEAYVAFNVAI